MSEKLQLTGIGEAVIRAKGQTALAKTIGVRPQVVQRWVRVGYVPDEWVEKVEELYGIPAERLCNPKLLRPVSRKDNSEE
jgi:hypothetical protein